MRRGEHARIPRALLGWGVLPALPCLLAWARGAARRAARRCRSRPRCCWWCRSRRWSRAWRLQPIADASVLVLLIVSLALHFLLSGLGLLFFGPEGSRTAPLAGGALTLAGGFPVSGQVMLMVASAVVLSALFFLVFERTVAGKALRATAVNRIGARLVGIRPARTALLAYGCASLLGRPDRRAGRAGRRRCTTTRASSSA